MNEAQMSTVDKMRQVLAGTQALEFRQAGDDTGRYAWIDAVLRRMDYRQLKRPERDEDITAPRLRWPTITRALSRHYSAVTQATLREVSREVSLHS